MMTQYENGNLNAGSGTRRVTGAKNVFEFRTSYGARIYFRNEGAKINIFAISDKDNQGPVLDEVLDDYPQ
jgi:hypothetical protein